MWIIGGGGKLYMGSQAMAMCHKMGVANLHSSYNDLPMMDSTVIRLGWVLPWFNIL